MRFQSQHTRKRCFYCNHDGWKVLGKTKEGTDVECEKCGEYDLLLWNGTKWEGEKERYDKNPESY